MRRVFATATVGIRASQYRCIRHAASVGDPVDGAGQGPMLLHALSREVERAGKPPVAAEAPLPPHFAEAGFGDAL